ncbi:Uma2 family endonuclease [Cryptosporangium sp. NPDC048952]|uniref:Uma2 family endonuclease n=1 Tax=Cryptosporangium sp. NPDC048952 TaxID=3363961 RepID=UPI003710F53B
MSMNALDQGTRKQRGRRRPIPWDDAAVWTPDEPQESAPSPFRDDFEVPAGGFTVADLLAMPETHYRIELTDGVLTVSPAPQDKHQFFAMAFGMRLYGARSSGYTVNQGIDVQLGDRTTRIPDVAVLRARSLKGRRIHTADDIVVAIEVVSPTSGRIDRTLKPLVYADAKVPYYWRIELEPELIAVVHRLDDGAYVEVSRGPRIDVTEPFLFAVDLAEFVDPDA